MHVDENFVAPWTSFWRWLTVTTAHSRSLVTFVCSCLLFSRVSEIWNARFLVFSREESLYIYNQQNCSFLVKRYETLFIYLNTGNTVTESNSMLCTSLGSYILFQKPSPRNMKRKCNENINIKIWRQNVMIIYYNYEVYVTVRNMFNPWREWGYILKIEI